MKKNLIKNTFCQYMLGVLICVLVGACSSDDESEVPVIVNNITINEASYALAEDGTATIEFAVEPADAKITSAVVKLNSVENENALMEVTSLTQGANGLWKAKAKVSDFSRVAATQSVYLMVYQEKESAAASAGFTLTDPYAIDYKLAYPFTINYRSAKDQSMMTLPVFITTAEGQEVSDITNIEVSLNPQEKVTKDDFIVEEIEGGDGFTIQLKEEAVAKLSGENYIRSGFIATITTTNGRKAMLTNANGFMMCPPVVTMEDNQMNFSLAKIRTTGYEEFFTIDSGAKLKRLGLYNGPGTEFAAADGLFTELGLYQIDGTTEVDSGPQFILLFFPADLNAEVFISDDPDADYSPDTYFYVNRVTADWKHNGRTYERICGDFRLKVNLTK